MGLLIRFNTPKPKKFDIPPRYHDPDKEEREARERRIRKELGMEREEDKPKGYRDNIKGQFREESKRLKFKGGQRRKSNLMVLIIFLLLALAAYYYLSKYSFF